MTSSTTLSDALAARESADAAILAWEETALSAITDDPDHCVTNRTFMGQLLAHVGSWDSVFSYQVVELLGDMFEEKVGDMFESFRVMEDGTFLLLLALGQEGATMDTLRESEQLADFFTAMSAALVSHGVKFTVSVLANDGIRQTEVRESFRVIDNAGTTLRFRPQLRGHAQKTYPNLRAAFKDSFTPMSSGIVSFPHPID